MTAASLVILAACSRDSNRGTAAATPPTIACGAPLRVAVIQDVTQSGKTNVTPQATIGEFDPLIAAIKPCGGEIAFGFIHASSNHPLLRYFVAKPAPPPTPPSFVGPSFQVSRDKRAYAADLAEHHRVDSARLTKAHEEGARFRESVRALLEVPADAPSTDVWGAISRCAQFLGEVEAVTTDESRQGPGYCLVISDMEHNTSTRPIRYLPGQLLVVNGTPAASVGASKNVHHFESIAAAIRAIIPN